MNRYFNIVTLILITSLFFCCRSRDTKVMGIYASVHGDTLNLVEDHSFRVELMYPDTADTNQFKITTGRWHREKRKIIFNVDSRSLGTYWECAPLKIRCRRLKRPMVCDESEDQLVFKKTSRKKIKKQYLRALKEEEELKKEKAEQKRKEIRGED